MLMVLRAVKLKVSFWLPPTRCWMLVKLSVPFVSANDPAVLPVMVQVVATLLPVRVLVPAPPSMLVVPLRLPVPDRVNPSLPEPPTSLPMPLNTVVVFRVPESPPLMAQVLVPSVAARVLLPVPPAMVPPKLPTPLARVNVSLPDPPFNVPMPLNVVVVFKVPALAPLIAQALVPSVAVSASLPPPPVMAPLNDARPEASVNVSLPDPPFRVSMPLNVVVVFRVPVFAALIAQALVPSVAVSASLPPPPVMAQLNDARPEASVNVSLPDPPFRLSMPLNVVVVFRVPVFAALIAQALVPSVAAKVSLPPLPSM